MRALAALARKVAMLAGWRRNVAAFAFGALCTLTLAPFYLFPLLIPSFTGLYWLLEGAASRRRMFWDGWWWGWGFYMTGLYWVCIALFTDAEKFAWLLPFTLFGLTGVIAIYSGVACWLMSWLLLRGLTRLFVFSVVWMGVEMARGYLFTGFPWNLPGYSFGFSDASLQLASLIGAYGLTWYAVLLGLSGAVPHERRGLLFAAVLWGVLALGTAWGGWRLYEANQVPQEKRFVEGVMLRLVQANIQQPHKWDPKLRMKGMQEHVTLTQAPGLEKITHVIWPETAVPYVLQSATTLSRLLGSAVPEGKILITGTLRMEGEGEEIGSQIWNSLVAINHDGNIVGSYDKVRLVPFGEFQPFRDYLPKEWLTPVGDKDFSSGPAVHRLDWPGLPPLLPLICYEVIFPVMIISSETRPAMLLSVTNDAWFGTSTGPYQHYQMARMRAVELGVPLVRVANTGITAIVDAVGQVVAYIPLGHKAFVDSPLPVSQNEPTTYSKYNIFFVQLLMMIMILLILRQKIGGKD